MKAPLKGLGLIFALLGVNALLLWLLFSATAAQANSLEGAPALRPGFPGLPQASVADKDWIITTNVSDSVINIIDPETNTVYGPFLKGELGSGGGQTLDVAVTPDGKTALISNFGDAAVFFVDVSNPISPSLITSVTLPMFAEDIDVSPDGKFALVTDGGFSPLIVTLDVIQHTIAYTASLSPYSFQSVDIGPDGTVVSADYFGQRVNALTIDDTGYVTNLITYTTHYTYPGVSTMAYPVNAYIAPDGKTVLTAIATAGTVSETQMANVYRITAPGVLTSTGLPTYTEIITGLPGGQQSIGFSEDGKKAYVVSAGENITHPAQLSVLDILGPGQVSLNASGVVTLTSPGTSQLFGVDVIAVVGDKAYVGNHTISGASTNLAVVDLNTFTMTALPVHPYPAGVAVIRSQRGLEVGIDGPGAGKVTSVEAGIDCGVTCTNLLNYQAAVTLTATPDPDSLFLGWSGACEGNGVCNLLMTETKQVTATFVPDSYTVTVALTGTGSGGVSSVPAGIDCGSTCAAAFDYGITVTLTAEAEAGSVFVGWSGACATTEPVCVLLVDEAKDAVAEFKSYRIMLPQIMKK